MKTAVTRTSIDAYYGFDLNPQHKAVMKALKALGESCISDIAAYLRMERSTIAGRMNELKNADVLVFVGKKKSNRTGVTSEFYRTKNYKQSLF